MKKIIFFLNQFQKSIKSLMNFIDYLAYQMLDGLFPVLCYFGPIYVLYKVTLWLNLKTITNFFIRQYQKIKIEMTSINSASIDDFALTKSLLIIWSTSIPITLLVSSIFPYRLRGRAFWVIQACCILIAKVSLGTTKERKRNIQDYKKKECLILSQIEYYCLFLLYLSFYV